jgi:hypothetical protein
MSYQPNRSRQVYLVCWTLYAVLSLVLLAALVFSIDRLFGKVRYAPLSSVRYLVVWACIVNVLSAVLFLGFGRLWRSRFGLFATIDFAISTVPFLLIYLFRLPPQLHAHYVALTYVSFAFLKYATLVWYAYFHCITATYNAVRWWVVLSSLVVYLGFAAWISQTTWPTGDGVHYLLLTHSLVADHDIDLANNYRNGDYHSFYPPHADEHAVKTSRGEALPIHDIGLPLLLMPGYILARKTGALVELAVAADISALGIFELSLELGAGLSNAVLTWALFAFTAPVLVFASEVSPEIVGAAVLLWAIICFLRFIQKGRMWHLFGGAVLVSTMPWLSIRYWMYAGPLLAVMAAGIILKRIPATHERCASVKKLLWLLALPTVISTAVFVIFDKLRYGISLPNAGYVLDVRALKNVQLGFMPQVGFLGLMFDRAFGLFPIAPIYILVFAGAAKIWRRCRAATVVLLMPTTSYVLFVSFSQYWYGGWSPAARFLVSAGVVWAALAALCFPTRFAGLLTIVLSMWTFVTTFILMAYPNTRFVAVPDTTRGGLGVFLQQHFWIDPLTWLFPSFIHAGLGDYCIAMGWVAVITCGAWWLSGQGEVQGSQSGVPIGSSSSKV